VRLRQWEYFDAVLRNGSVRAGAAALHVSEPAISGALQELERELKVTLFARSGRRLVLTPDGERLAPLIRNAVAAADDIVKTAVELRHPTGPLRVGLVPSFALPLVRRLVTLCETRFPDVSLEVVEGGSLTLEREVLDGDLDLAVTTRAEGISPVDRRLAVVGLFSGRLVAVVGPTHPLSHRAQLTATDLHDQPLILYRPGYLVRELVVRLLGESALRNVLYTSDNGATTRQLIMDGEGVSFTPALAIGDARPDRELVRVPLAEAPAVELAAVYPAGRYVPRLVAETLFTSDR
jgi:DNA-binding transcriptional LysR family regulator